MECINFECNKFELVLVQHIEHSNCISSTSCPQNNPPENDVEPVPAKSELPPKKNLPENNAEPVHAKSELPQKQSSGK